MKRLLVLNFYPAAYPPTTGGELRYYNIYEELSKYFDVTLLSSTYPQPSVKIREHSKTFREYLVPQEMNVHGRIHNELKGKVGLEYSALVSALGSYYPNNHHQVFIQLYESSDIIIHESPFMIGYDLLLGLDTKPRIYNSYNNEAELAKQMWDGEDANKYIELFTKMEERLVKQVDLVFTVSEEDRKSFIKSYKIQEDKIKLAPNGIHPEQWNGIRLEKNKQERIKAFFIGSKHPPNYKAVDFIINTLANQCKNIDFIIAGDCCTPFMNVKKPNVKLMGRVDNEKKYKLFAEADVAINPMFSGGGTNLKTLEFLSAGIPLLSTGTGVRGLGLHDGKNYFKVEKHNFASRLQDIVKDHNGMKRVSLDGKRYIEKNFSWRQIVTNMKVELEKLSKVKPKTLLILNHSRLSTELAGKRERIKELYGRLSESYNIILLCLNDSDLLDINQLNNQFVELCFPSSLKQLINYKNENNQINNINSIFRNNQVLLQGIYKKIYSLADGIILLDSLMVPFLKIKEKRPIIYDSFPSKPKQKFSLEGEVSLYKKTLYSISDLIVINREKDKDYLKYYDKELKKNVLKLSNAVNVYKDDLAREEIKEVKKMFQGKHVILFIGNENHYNALALQYISKQLAPLLKNCYFIVIGSVCKTLNEIVPPNMLFFESVKEPYKYIVAKIADIAINPVLNQSDYNSNILEYFSLKIPIITTPEGCFEFEIVHEQHALISNLKDFLSNINKLLEDKSLQNKLINHSSHFIAKEMSWDELGKNYKKVLDNLMLIKGVF
ncbi:glycosyltransferase [Peribacillus frigoritolerans]|uniref:glycosyltransferase n=1 Tax=Peribacillus frigoritolerans TaxID=450367 RepID=UPI0007BF0343